MRSIRTIETVILVVLVAASSLWLVRKANAQQSPNSTQIVFSVTGATFDYDTPPSSGDNAFGFWIWCSGPSSTSSYSGTCDGSMYFYGISPSTQPVKGTVLAGAEAGQYQMTVWARHSTYQCKLENVPPTVSGPHNTVDVSCTSPAGSATVTNAEVQVSR
jgi:hypothetical protein